jgi:LysR family glycine cleavage system transcriptional activator
VKTPIRGLRSFCIAAKCLSFKQAAKQLHISPSAVSHQIRTLEVQLNKQLFRRQTRSIELTKQGVSFYQSIAPIIAQLDNTISAFSEEKLISSISISMPEFFASELFVPLLNEWSEKYPHINLHLDTVKSHTERKIDSDLSIVLTGTPPSNVIVHELFPISYIPACSPSLFKTLKSFGLGSLQQAPLILHKSRPWSWHQWASENHVEHFEPKRIVQVDSMFAVARAAQQGLGIALIPLPMSQSWFDDDIIHALFKQPLETKDKYYLVQHDPHTSRKEISLFVEWLFDALKKSVIKPIS